LVECFGQLAAGTAGKLVLASWRTELWVVEKGDGQLTVDQVEIYMLGVDGYDIYIYILGTIYGNI